MTLRVSVNCVIIKVSDIACTWLTPNRQRSQKGQRQLAECREAARVL